MKVSNIKCKLKHSILSMVICWSYMFEYSVSKDMKETMIKEDLLYIFLYPLTLFVQKLKIIVDGGRVSHIMCLWHAPLGRKWYLISDFENPSSTTSHWCIAYMIINYVLPGYYSTWTHILWFISYNILTIDVATLWNFI